MRIKVCGLTSLAHARAAVDAGVDAIGLMFYPKSSRIVSVATAREIAASLPALVSAVAVFADPAEADVAEVCARVPVDLLQFHGDESRVFCESFGRPYIKGVRMRSRDALNVARDAHPNARGYLVDAYEPGEMGGTGNRFDWNQLAEDLARDGVDAARDGLILAGGLTAENVAQAISIVMPFAVDVSSGVETAPGQKSAALIGEFVAASRRQMA